MKITAIGRIMEVMNTRFNMRFLEYRTKRDALMEKALNSQEPGIGKARLCDEDVVVSLTSYGRRINDVAPAIESIMQGSAKPNRIVLWLGKDMNKKELPIALQRQRERGLEVEYCKDLGSYTKLLPSLKKFPQSTIITIDDDMIYSYDTVERLVREHKQYPNDIIANVVRKMKLRRNGRLASFRKSHCLTDCDDVSFRNMLMGVGGVLYPPCCLDPEVTNEEVFTDLCKHADDAWFYAMAVKAGTMTRKCPSHNPAGKDYLRNEDVQDTALKNLNDRLFGRCDNDAQLEAVFGKYDLWKALK